MIEFTIGDLTTEPVDAVVLPANPDLIPGGGASGAIHRAAGPEVAAGVRPARWLRDRRREGHLRRSAPGPHHRPRGRAGLARWPERRGGAARLRAPPLDRGRGRARRARRSRSPRSRAASTATRPSSPRRSPSGPWRRRSPPIRRSSWRGSSSSTRASAARSRPRRRLSDGLSSCVRSVPRGAPGGAAPRRRSRRPPRRVTSAP